MGSSVPRPKTFYQNFAHFIDAPPNGFIKAFKALRKLFKVPQRVLKMKNLLKFLRLILDCKG